MKWALSPMVYIINWDTLIPYWTVLIVSLLFHIKSSFLLIHPLGGSTDGSCAWVPVARMGDLN